MTYKNNKSKIKKITEFAFLILGVLFIIAIMIEFLSPYISKTLINVGIPNSDISKFFILQISVILCLLIIVIILKKEVSWFKINWWVVSGIVIFLFASSSLLFFTSQLTTEKFSVDYYSKLPTDENTLFIIKERCYSDYIKPIKGDGLHCQLEINPIDSNIIITKLLLSGHLNSNYDQIEFIQNDGKYIASYFMALPNASISKHQYKFYYSQNNNLKIIEIPERSLILIDSAIILSIQEQRNNTLYTLLFIVLSFSLLSIFVGIKAIKDLCGEDKNQKKKK